MKERQIQRELLVLVPEALTKWRFSWVKGVGSAEGSAL
jgi:hypothetical protein